MLIKLTRTFISTYIEVEYSNLIKFSKKDKELSIILKDISDNGLPYTKTFLNKNIPGKINGHKTEYSEEDIIEYLQNKFLISNVETFHKKDGHYEIFDYCDIKHYYASNFDYIIREYKNKFEYCIIKDYEKQYINYRIYNMPMKNIILRLTDVGNKVILVSVIFSKDIFTVPKIKSWLNQYKLEAIYTRETNYVDMSYKIVNAIKFKSIPIIISERGFNKVYFNRNELNELSREYIFRIDKERHNSKEIKRKIVYNGNLISYIPEIELNSNDCVFSNGNLFSDAKFIGDFEGTLAIFQKKNDWMPICIISDNYANIEIYTYNDKNYKTVEIDFSYYIE